MLYPGSEVNGRQRGMICLQAAVIKTKWLADRLGGSVFSVVCKFEHGSRGTVSS